MIQQSPPGGPTTGADGNSSRPGPASSWPRRIRGPRLARAWHMADEAFRSGGNRLEPTMAGQVCKQLR